MGKTPEQKINPDFGVDKNGNINDHYLGIYISTLEGKIYAKNDDYIIKVDNLGSEQHKRVKAGRFD
jgi:hypothetical protein